MGLHLSDTAEVRLENCVLHEHNFSLFYAEDDPQNEATLALVNCSGICDMVFYDDIEPHDLRVSNCNFGPQPNQTLDEYFYETYINVPVYQQNLEKGKLPFCMAMHDMGFQVDKGDNMGKFIKIIKMISQ